MTDQHKKNQRLILIIFAMTIIPFLFAFFLFKNPALLGGRTNHGQLITPLITTERAELTGFDDFSKEHTNELLGHWVLLHVVAGEECGEVCQDAIYKTRQLRLMMSKDLTRIRRAAVLMSVLNADTLQRWSEEDSRLLRLVPAATMREKLSQIRAGEFPDGWLLIMDPLGNLMMQYEPGFDPYKVKNDLKNLLKISQIG